jgi:hypothetical protein
MYSLLAKAQCFRVCHVLYRVAHNTSLESYEKWSKTIKNQVLSVSFGLQNQKIRKGLDFLSFCTRLVEGANIWQVFMS